MKLEQLERVVEIAKARSISKAADNLFLSQPNLSTSVKELEAELGAQIFVRNHKGVEITPFGMTFIKYAEKIVGQMRTLKQLSKEQLPHISQTLSVANSHFRPASMAVAMMLNAENGSNCRYLMRCGISEDCINWTADGICDVGVVSHPVSEERTFRQLMKIKNLQYHPIATLTMKIMVGKGNPFYHQQESQLSMAQLKGLPMICYDDTTVHNYLRTTRVGTMSEAVRVVVNDRATMMEMLEFTDGYFLGFSNDLIYQNIPQFANVRSFDIQDLQVRHQIAWIAPKAPEMSPLAKTYAQLLEQLYNLPGVPEVIIPDVT